MCLHANISTWSASTLHIRAAGILTDTDSKDLVFERLDCRYVAHAYVNDVSFDSPMARSTLPPWRTAEFYADDAAWWADQPLRQIAAGAWPPGRLLLHTGAAFHDEMLTCSAALRAAGAAHELIADQTCAHHWDSGWLERALALLTVS